MFMSLHKMFHLFLLIILALHGSFHGFQFADSHIAAS